LSKILISGSFWHGSLEESYARAFESLGWTAVRFDWEQQARAHPLARVAFADKLLRSKIADRVGKWLLDATAETRPDLLLIIKGRTASPELLTKVRMALAGQPLVNFNPDSTWEPQNTSRRLRASIPVYDAHFTWNGQLVARFLDEGAKAAHFLPFAYDPLLHYPIAESETVPEFDAAFVGTYAPERDKLLSQLRGCKIGIWGNGWERATKVPRSWIQSKAVYGEEATRMLSRAACAINILRPQNVNSHNMRTFEIPATRHAMLASRSLEQSEWFAEGETIECFASLEELLENVRLLAAHPEHARRIARGGYERVREETYAKRARTMLDILGLSL
jgi:hypothetical protein